MFKKKIIRKEVDRFQGNPHVTFIDWQCQVCKKRFVSLQQQQFTYCPHCGVRFTHRQGGCVYGEY